MIFVLVYVLWCRFVGVASLLDSDFCSNDDYQIGDASGKVVVAPSCS